ncbi:MAG: YdcF family protein [Chloroflexota bacterium]
MIELLIRTLCDPLPEFPVDAAYLFAQTADNQAAVFSAGLELIRQQQARQLLFTGSAACPGYPGFEAWQQELVKRGLSRAVISGVPNDSFPLLHTLIEATALVRYAHQRRLTSLVVVASPFQQLRAFMTTISVVLREYPELQVYNRVGAALPWHETVIHSQGTLECQRHALIQSELDRIERYHAQGDLASTEQVLRYLNRRDG